MNKEQIISFVRYCITALGGSLASKGLNDGIVSALTGPDAVMFYSGLISVIIPTLLSYFSHTSSAKIATVEAMPEVKKIIVSSTDTTMAAAAADPTRPKVTL